MNKYWLLVIAASFCEVGWVVGLKHATNIGEWIATILAIVVTFWALTYASSVLPTSTVYAVFVGLGTAGTVVAEMLFFGEAVNWLKICLIATLLIGVIGLKVVTKEEEATA